MWQTKYALAVPKNLGFGLNFRPCSEDYFLSGCPYPVLECKRKGSFINQLFIELRTGVYHVKPVD